MPTSSPNENIGFEYDPLFTQQIADHELSDNLRTLAGLAIARNSSLLEELAHSCIRIASSPSLSLGIDKQLQVVIARLEGRETEDAPLYFKTAGDIEIWLDYAHSSVKSTSPLINRPQHLTRIERSMLYDIMRDSFAVHTFAVLMENATGQLYTDEEARPLVKQHIRRVRKKIGHSIEFPIIYSFRDIGFSLTPSDVRNASG